MNKIKKIVIFIVLLFVLLGYTGIAKANVYTYPCYSGDDFKYVRCDESSTGGYIIFQVYDCIFGTSFSAPSSGATITQGSISGYIKDKNTGEIVSNVAKVRFGRYIFDSGSRVLSGWGVGFTANWVSGHTYIVHFDFNGPFRVEHEFAGSLNEYDIPCPSLNYDAVFTAQIGTHPVQQQPSYNIEGQLRSYDCLTNQAVFQLSSNFNLQSVNIDGLDQLGDTSKIINYTFDSNTWNLTVNFASDIDHDTTQHTLFLSGSGTNSDDGSAISGAKGHIDFVTGCSTEEPIGKGKLIIISPANGEQFESGTSSIQIKVGYGGNVEEDFPGSRIQGAIKYEDISVVADIDLTDDYAIVNNTTYWNATVNLCNNGEDGTYTMNASLFSDAGLQLSADSISFVIGKSSGNPLIDFLNHLWSEFKDWFIKTMKYLFVPTSSQMQELANSVKNMDLKNYIPVLDLSDMSCDCMTIMDTSEYPEFFGNSTVKWEVCISSISNEIWNAIRVGADAIIIMSLLFLIVREISK